VSESTRHSKREVSRAGEHLATRLDAVRGGERRSLIDPDDASDLRARDVVEWWGAQHVGPMLAVHDVVSAFAPDLRLGENEALRAVSYRPKRFETMIEKLTREPGKLADMVDIGGVRAVVNHQDEVDELRLRLTEALDVRRSRDWVRRRRATGYRAVHLHVREDGRMIEVQLRTFGQDAWANVVEQESLVSGVNYKAGQGERAVLEFFGAVADTLAMFELGEEHAGLPERLHRAYREAQSLLRSPTLRDLDR
jgi:putative GTP pyrophosphokinase